MPLVAEALNECRGSYSCLGTPALDNLQAEANCAFAKPVLRWLPTSPTLLGLPKILFQLRSVLCAHLLQ